MRTAKKSGYLFAVLLLAVSACAGGPLSLARRIPCPPSHVIPARPIPATPARRTRVIHAGEANSLRAQGLI
jgi:hypothetical protein